MTRTFTASPAVRKNVPLLIALIGPSGGGKSYSALRLATGIQRVQPGEIDVIDSEADRALQYADTFKFHHVPFAAPFGSLDYLEVLQYCVGRGARTVIVDSMSHEHEGPGGMLTSADAYIEERIARKVQYNDLASAEGRDADAARAKLKISSFIEPKAHRSRLIQGMLQMHVNLILCFRAKPKIEPVSGKEPIQLGWQPIGGDEFWYEMTARALLLPGANGVPEWDLNKLEKGEKIAARRPAQFERILRNGAQLSEDMGEQMARWAAGAEAVAAGREALRVDGQHRPPGDKAKALAAIADTANMPALEKVIEQIGKRAWSELDKLTIDTAIETRTNDLGKE